DVESTRSYIDELYSSDPQRCLDALVCLRNSVIGSDRQKGAVIAQGVVPRLLQLLSDDNFDCEHQISLEAAITLGSLAKGTDQHVLALIDLGVVPSLLQVLFNQGARCTGFEDLNLPHPMIEAALRCLRTIFQHPAAPSSLLFKNPDVIGHLLRLTNISLNSEMYVSMILMKICK
ncbi:hypothetical protein QAD02_003307, partial [Eretmocerus hayati]